MGFNPTIGDTISYFNSYKTIKNTHAAKVEDIIRPERKGKTNKYVVRCVDDGTVDTIESWQIHHYIDKVEVRSNRIRKGAITDV